MRFLVLLGFVGLVHIASATPEIMDSLHRSAGMVAASKLSAMKCMLCHSPRPPKRNAFGQDVEHAVESVSPELMTRELWADLAVKDSDGDGANNSEEIAADTKPGDPTDTPTAEQVGAVEAELTPEAPASGPIPKHSFHPLLVHFPIALLLFGIALELWGYGKRDSNLRRAGWLALLWGALSITPALLTGLRAFFQLGMKWEGDLLVHFILAITSLVLSVSALLWRRKGEIESPGYLALLVLTALAVGATGHFGAQMVFG